MPRKKWNLAKLAKYEKDNLKKNESIINFFPTNCKPRDLYWWFLINIRGANNFGLTETVPENKKKEGTSNHEHIL